MTCATNRGTWTRVPLALLIAACTGEADVERDPERAAPAASETTTGVAPDAAVRLEVLPGGNEVRY